MRPMSLKHVVLALALVHLGPAGAAVPQTTSTAEAIRYTVSFPRPETHYMEVAAQVPTAGRSSIEMMMAVWTPGSYLIREYARQVEAVRAVAGGRSLTVEKSAKNRWRVQTGGARIVTVSYRVYAHEMSQRTNWVDTRFALINGAPTFLTLADSSRRPHEVALNLPAAWKRSMTGLAPLTGGEHRYVAADFDMLVDSPILAGNPSIYEFVVGGKRHYLVNEGDTETFDGARAAKDFETIVREQHRFWGDPPYDKYVALNILVEDRGALEHKNSTVLMTAPAATRRRAAYLRWLNVITHEFFHVWNGKRLRPVELGPFDYENEAYTRSLWIVEGLTDYYADLLAHRAGLITRTELLDSLSAAIEDVQTTPGRFVQSVELASFDAWIKFYRPDENSANSSIDYYSKGKVLAFLLDARIRRATGGARDLDAVLRAAYGKYSGAHGFTPAQFRQVAEQVAGTSLVGFWNSFVSGTEELDYSEAFSTFGLRFGPPATTGRASLGVSTRSDGGRLLVSEVPEARTTTLNVNDEILAIDGVRVTSSDLRSRLNQYEPQSRVSVLVARRGALVPVDVTLAVEPPRGWQLEFDTTASEIHRDRWLGAR
jgi:predicted metalloprotease with PDZ domain